MKVFLEKKPEAIPNNNNLITGIHCLTDLNFTVESRYNMKFCL